MRFLPGEQPYPASAGGTNISFAIVGVRAAILRTNEFAVTPWAITLSNTDQLAASAIVSGGLRNASERG